MFKTQAYSAADNIRLGCNWLAVIGTLAYNIVTLIADVKCFIEHVLEEIENPRKEILIWC